MLAYTVRTRAWGIFEKPESRKVPWVTARSHAQDRPICPFVCLHFCCYRTGSKGAWTTFPLEVSRTRPSRVRIQLQNSNFLVSKVAAKWRLSCSESWPSEAMILEQTPLLFLPSTTTESQAYTKESTPQLLGRYIPHSYRSLFDSRLGLLTSGRQVLSASTC